MTILIRSPFSEPANTVQAILSVDSLPLMMPGHGSRNSSHWYNYNHHHSGIKFLTPHQRHSGQGEEILKKRHQLYEAAKARHPERWTRETRNWTLINEVWLNPEKSQVEDITESKTTAS